MNWNLDYNKMKYGTRIVIQYKDNIYKYRLHKYYMTMTMTMKWFY